MDDFAWLRLSSQITDAPSFFSALFSPLAQGTIRPLSERLLFIAGYGIFGLHAFPFRLLAFLTFFADIALLAYVTASLTRLRAAGIAAALLWTVNSSLYMSLSWTSAYNQLLCAFFLLSSFALFRRYTETGDRRLYILQAGAFILGFGALELMVVYPALALSYCLCCARKYWKTTLPLFAISLAYASLHRWLAARTVTKVYELSWDADIFATFWTYCHWVMGADGLALAKSYPLLPYYAAEAVAGSLLVLFLMSRLRQRRWLAGFFAAWFVICLGIYLPLKNHVTDYYLTVPSLGLAMLAGWAVALAVQRRGLALALAGVGVAAYAVPSVWSARTYTAYYYAASQRTRHFVQRLAYAHQLHKNKLILVRGMDNDLFWSGFFDEPGALFGLSRVYLTEETEPVITPLPSKPIGRFFLPDRVAQEMLQNGTAVAYALEDVKLRNITGWYRSLAASSKSEKAPRSIDAGTKAYQSFLGPGWHEIEPEGTRWMSKSASFTLRGPLSPQGTLTLRGYRPPEQTATDPIRIRLLVENKEIGARPIRSADGRFELTFALPPELKGQARLLFTIEVNRTIQAKGDQRELGLLFGKLELDP